MRTSLFAIWLIAVAATALPNDATVAAQPPSETKIVIQPRRASAVLEKDFPGFIIIRPKNSASFPSDPSPRPAQPRRTISTNPSVATQPSPANPANPTTPAPKKGGKAVFDYWFVAAVEGERIGYLHWSVSESEKDGKKFLIGVKHQRFTVDRFGQVVTQFGEESTVETPEGEVLVTSMRQGLGKNQALALSGVVEGKTLKVTGEGSAKTASKSIPWPEGVVGVAREPELLREKKLKPGETFEYRAYVGQVNRVIKVTVTFEAEENTSLWANTPPRKLRRYVSKMEPLGKFKLPAATTWVDEESGEPLRVEFDFPGFGGRVTFLRTTKEAATAPVVHPIKLFNAQSIRLNREIPGVHSKRSIVYRVSLPRDDEPGTAFPSDDRQVIKNLDEKKKTLEMHISSSRGPKAGAKPEPAPGKDYLGSNFFINWDNALVKGHAMKALAGLPAAATDWDKAKAVERWVNRNMQAVEFSQAMATANNVARTLSGDCTEYAMLGAAMCRAAGIPSRTVLGLVYAPGPGGKPYLAYHMWFEAYAQGQWLPLDATLGQGGIGPGHVKIADHSWHDERTFAPLLPVLRVLMAKPEFEIVRVNP